jgi:XTP/dITP diphosphohydrolase
VKPIVIATHNAKKAGEMLTILRAELPGVEFKTLADYPGAAEPEETGDTYRENALIKARSAAAFTGETALADDAGLEIDALPGDLGVHSKRFAGDSSFEEKMARVLAMMAGVQEPNRTARFRCCIAMVEPGGEETTIEDTCEGRIAFAPSGRGGFGYDPIFWLPKEGCTMADLTSDQKHEVSHRGKVLRRLVQFLKTKRDSQAV